MKKVGKKFHNHFSEKLLVISYEIILPLLKLEVMGCEIIGIFSFSFGKGSQKESYNKKLSLMCSDVLVQQMALIWMGTKSYPQAHPI